MFFLKDSTNHSVRDYATKTPQFNLLQHDFFASEKIASSTEELHPLKGQAIYQNIDQPQPEGEARQVLLAYQRLAFLKNDLALVENLHQSGFRSASHIAALSEDNFVEKTKNIFANDVVAASEFYAKAVHVKTKALHFLAIIKDVVASPAYSELDCNIVAESLAFFKKLPGYTTLFGSMDYFETDPEQTIFSPSAYYFDLMRIIDEYITSPNKISKSIPQGYSLEERRPDLFNLKLTPTNSTTEIPYLRLCNSILATQTKILTGNTDAYKVLTQANYPFNLPFIRPLAELRSAMEPLDWSLGRLYTLMITNNEGANTVKSFDALRETVGLSTSDLKRLTLSLIAPKDVAPSYGYVSTYPNLPELLPVQGQGTVNLSPELLKITGVGTNFSKQLKIGDQLKVASIVRTVVKVVSDTEVNINAAPKLDKSNADYVILAKNGLDLASEFMDRTRLTQNELVWLISQDLSSKEISEKYQQNFFINDSGEQLPPIFIEISNDTHNQSQRLVNLSWARLDRLSRFIRLSRLCGFDFAELQWVMTATKCKEINADLIANLGRIIKIQCKYKWALPDIAAWIHLLRGDGQGTGINPQDQFNLIFNTPSLLNGQDPYAASSTIPFNQFRNPPQPWIIEGTAESDTLIRARLRAALDVNDNDLTVLSNYILCLNGKKGDNNLSLSLDNLSWLYRLSKLSNYLNWTVSETLIFLGLYFNPTDPNLLEPSSIAISLSLEELGNLLKTAHKILENNFDIWQLKYIITGDGQPFYQPVYNPSSIGDFINQMVDSNLSVRLSLTDLSALSLGEAQAEILIAALAKKGLCDTQGLFLKESIDYSEVADLLPIQLGAETTIIGFDNHSFIMDSKGIIAEESEDVFNALLNSSPPVLDKVSPTIGSISQNFNTNTNIDFLKPIFTVDSESKFNAVRELLLTTTEGIDQLLTTLAIKIDEQQNCIVQNLASYLQSTPELVSAMLPLTISLTGFSNYRSVFLTHLPADTEPSSKVISFIDIIARWMLVAKICHLDSIEMKYITSSEGKISFNIQSLRNLTLADLSRFYSYANLRMETGNQSSLWVQYFQSKVLQQSEFLTGITGWNTKDISILKKYFRLQAEENRPDTAEDVLQLAKVFDANRCFGARAETLLSLVAIAHRDIEDSQGLIIESSWIAYEQTAQIAKNLVETRFNGDARSTTTKLLEESLNTSSSEALKGYVLWKINAIRPEICSINDLYYYLLLDIEMGACFTTSLITQALASLQLYLQRCRTMQEPGINKVEIPKAWWSWMMNYRVWEANRRIFVYPENYLEPSLRRGCTPEFKELSDDLLQNDPTKDNVVKPFEKYINSVTNLGTLRPVGAYQADAISPDTGEEQDTIFIIGKTKIEPKQFFWRSRDILEWSPWREISLPINGDIVSPVYAFGRLFIFWSEFDLSQSNAIANQNSTTQTVDQASIKYTFFNNGEWASTQTLKKSIIINTYPNSYDVIDKHTELSNALQRNNSFWFYPNVLSTGTGFAGAGKISLTKGSVKVQGSGNTWFLRELRAGDSIICFGEKRLVSNVINDSEFETTKPWSNSVSNSGYKIRYNSQSTRFRPFKGRGTVTAIANQQMLIGHNTFFSTEITDGDSIQVGQERYLMGSVANNTSIVIIEKWKCTYSQCEYYIFPGERNDEQIVVTYGASLDTSSQIDPEKKIVLENKTQDTFIGAQNKLAASTYNNLELARQWYMFDHDKGNYVTLPEAFFLDSNLEITSHHIFMADYQAIAAASPQPFRAELVRMYSRLSVVNSDNVLWDNHWSINLPNKLDSVRFSETNSEHVLLSNINSELSSLFCVGNKPGCFIFDNSDDAFLLSPENVKEIGLISEGILVTPRSWPIQDLQDSYFLVSGACTSNKRELKDRRFIFQRLNTRLMPLLQHKLFAKGVAGMLSLSSQYLEESNFSRFYPPPGNEPSKYIVNPPSNDMDFNGSYGAYFWEIFFHDVFLIADRLSASRKYEEALSWFEYIFNPTQPPEGSSQELDNKRFWRFRPFREMNLTSLLTDLSDPKQIRRYNYNPFDPDAISALRPVTYAKVIVMRYVETLTNWGDSLFSQYTRESITQATNLYTLAATMLGKRPCSRGSKPLPDPKSFNEIKDTYGEGDIPEFLILLENTLDEDTNEVNNFYENQPINDINSYFQVPENSDFMALWDKIDDRLFKIRHCMNIDGQTIPLALFSPPIDPKMLVAASSSGLGIAEAITQISAVPHYRFSYLIAKAQNLCGQLSSLSMSLLSILEKKDAEALNSLLAGQESVLLKLQTLTREQEIEDAIIQEKSLQFNHDSAQSRYNHYTDLLKNPISHLEQVSLDAMLAAMVSNVLASVSKTAAAIGYAVPQIGSPFAMTYGGKQVGSVLNATSGVFDIAASISTFISQQNQVLASYERREEDWTLQAQLAKYDTDQLAKQLASAALKKEITKHNMVIHNESVKQNAAKIEFMKSKFSNEELYQWMANRLMQIQYQTYTLTYQFALLAQRAYQYEYNTNRNFLSFSCWNSPHQGMTVAENITLDLNQMEASTFEYGRSLEIERIISLAAIDPLALFDLRLNGSCFFSIGELLFDSDYPGHFNRKIKSVSVSIPSVVGPYQNIKGMLIQLGNHVVLKADSDGLDAVKFLLAVKGSQPPTASSLRSNWNNSQQIALSRGQDETGLFSTDYADVRYLPFEGTGAVSSWKLELPKNTNNFDFESIADVIITLRYTAADGGASFRKNVCALEPLKVYSSCSYIDCLSMYYTQWQSFMAQSEPKAKQQILSLQMLDFVPPQVDEARLTAVYIRLQTTDLATGDFLTLKLTESLMAKLQLSTGNDQMYIFSEHEQNNPLVASVCMQPMQLIFDLGKTPLFMKDKESGNLNPKVLQNIEIVFYYNGIKVQ